MTWWSCYITGINKSALVDYSKKNCKFTSKYGIRLSHKLEAGLTNLAMYSTSDPSDVLDSRVK